MDVLGIGCCADRLRLCAVPSNVGDGVELYDGGERKAELLLWSLELGSVMLRAASCTTTDDGGNIKGDKHRMRMRVCADISDNRGGLTSRFVNSRT